MDSADPRTQPTSQSQQQPHHHHHTQHHHTQPQQQQQQQQQHPQRQPQQPPNDQQQQQPHHIQPQLTQPQSMHQPQQLTHPPQHAQQNQPAGYVTMPQHNYPTHHMQMGHAYPHAQPPFPRGQYSAYGPNIGSPFTYGAYVQPYNQHGHPGPWQQQVSFTPTVPASTPQTQGLPNPLKTAPQPLKAREKTILQFVDPKTKKPIDLTGSEESKKSPSEAATNSTIATATTTTTPTKPTPTQQPKTIATATATLTTTTTKPTPSATTTTDNSAVPVNATITNNNVTNSSSTDRTSTSSPSISVPNLLLQKVSEDEQKPKSEPKTEPKQESKTEPKQVPKPEPKQELKPEPKLEPKPKLELKPEPKQEPKAELKPEPVTAKAISLDSKDKSKSEEKSEATKSESVVNNVEQPDGDKKLDDKDVEDCDEDSTEKQDDANGEIKLHYEKGQYNPTSNRNGKKKYSRQFMLDVCEKICKLDINSEVSPDSGMTSYNLDKSTDLFAPNYHQQQAKYQSTNRQNDPSRRQNPNNYTGRSSAGQERQRKIIVPSSSLTNEVELKTVSNPWRPGKEVKEEEVPDDVVEVEALKKKFRSILNKLTPQNFDNLAAAVTDMHIDTEAKLGEVIDIVFAKALAEPGYCVLYGQMCSHLKKITAGAANFGNTLLKRCQNQFQADIYSGINVEERKRKIEEEKDPEAKKHLDEELYEDMYRCIMRGLGLIKFIGELYKIEMLIDPIMFDCIQRLLSDPTSEESLECLCDLLKTIGEKLDRSSQASVKEKQKSQKPSKTNAYQNNKSLASVVASSAPKAQEPVATLDPIFEQLHKIRKNKDLPLSVRIRFKLLDVCDLREKDNWQSKGKDNNPKKLDEIKKDHLNHLESERQKSMGPRKSQEGRRGLGHGGGSSSHISSLGNDSGSNRNNFHSSPSSQSMRDHQYGEKMLQNNSDSHKQQEQHRAHATSVLANLSFLKKNPDDSDKKSLAPFGSSLRPTMRLVPGATTTATATSNATKPTTTNSTNANVAGGGSQ